MPVGPQAGTVLAWSSHKMYLTPFLARPNTSNHEGIIAHETSDSCASGRHTFGRLDGMHLAARAGYDRPGAGQLSGRAGRLRLLRQRMRRGLRRRCRGRSRLHGRPSAVRLPSLPSCPGSGFHAGPARRYGDLSVLHQPRPARFPGPQPAVDRAVTEGVKTLASSRSTGSGLRVDVPRRSLSLASASR